MLLGWWWHTWPLPMRHYTPRVVYGTNGLHPQDTIHLGWWEAHLNRIYKMSAKPSTPRMLKTFTHFHVPGKIVIPDSHP